MGKDQLTDTLLNDRTPAPPLTGCHFSDIDHYPITIRKKKSLNVF